ncbi:MAG: dihydropteroate synthase [Opitutales bacterium]
MGILNVTPDSFSDGSESETLEQVLVRAAEMVKAGADILDIGGESTRPGAEPVSESQELMRVLPVIRALRTAWPKLPLSIDTYKAGVAAAAIGIGADMVNDVWGLAHGLDPATAAVSPMAATVARLGCPVVLMHNRTNRHYGDFWEDLLGDLRASVARARQAGVAEHQIWLDPGFGFAKDVPHNLEVIKHLQRVVHLGYPVLVGTSRKSTIGKVLNRTVENRLDGTAASVVWAIQQGARMIRVHDVAAVRPFVQMADAIAAGLNFEHHG